MDIVRQEFVDRLFLHKDKQIIKVITGVRRSGKSTVMVQFQKKLRELGVAENQIIALNLEDYDLIDLLEPKKLHSYIKNRLVPGKMTYLFLDEIQNLPDFQRVVDSLFLQPNIDIYITGSNAYFLSGELATYLSGRYVTIEMLPFSFKEYLQTLEHSNLSLEEKYKSYIEKTSFPYVVNLGENHQEIVDYLRGVYSTIILKDVVSRYKISDTKMLESVVAFVFDNIGSPLSSKKIADTMTSNSRKIDPKTVEKFLTALQDCFIIYEAKRYDVKGKQHLKLFEKQYLVDVGLRSILLGKKGFDAGHVLENVVYLELIRRGYSVYVGKVGDTEVDFVAMNQEGNLYLQVAASVRDEATLTRELRPLQQIRDSYPKMILTLDQDPESDYHGIIRRNALEWLLEG